MNTAWFVGYKRTANGPNKSLIGRQLVGARGS